MFCRQSTSLGRQSTWTPKRPDRERVRNFFQRRFIYATPAAWDASIRAASTVAVEINASNEAASTAGAEFLRDPATEFQAALGRAQRVRVEDDPIRKGAEAAYDALRVCPNAVVVEEDDDIQWFGVAPSQYELERAVAAIIDGALDQAALIESIKGGDCQSKTVDLDPEARALAMLSMHPGWTDTKIAREVGVARTTLYDWPRYKNARALLKAGKNDRPRAPKSAKRSAVDDD
jgi:hypothetical protein